jgi:valyl-tRNA synthetase
LAREGLDRDVIGRDAFVERVRDSETRRRNELGERLAEASIAVDVEAGRTATEPVVNAARIAFVRLYDAGLLERAERVVDVCARCQTVVETIDAIPVPTEVVRFTLALGEVEVDVVDLELLPGVVAVAVPAAHPAAGGIVRVPLAREVPVVADDDAEAPWLVVPAHSAAGFEFARRNGLTPLPVLDRQGTHAAEGSPLGGLARFAARSAAAELVEAEGVVIGHTDVVEDQQRCGRCATSLVPVLGSHWFLKTSDIEVAAADAVRAGAVIVEDPDALELFVGRAERADSWCLSHQVWAGDAVPAARCIDCGNLSVTAEPLPSCGKCMGELVATDDVLDARFVAAIWPLALAGWPVDERGVAEVAQSTVVFGGRDDVTSFALPVAALGLRLGGVVPFGELVCVGVDETQ